ncbi:MAG: hypothetical protein ACT4QE_25620, partial [Anaerolineales bacterium]
MHKFTLAVGVKRAVRGVFDKSIRILVIAGLALSATGIQNTPAAQARTGPGNSAGDHRIPQQGPRDTATPTASGTPAVTATQSPIPSGTDLSSATPDFSATPSLTATPSVTVTEATATPTFTVSPLPSTTVEITTTVTVTPTQITTPTSTPTPVDDESVDISPGTGGRLTSRNGWFEIEFPSGAVERNTRIRFQSLSTTSISNPVGPIRQLVLTAEEVQDQRSVRQFLRPATFRIRLDKFGYLPGKVDAR